MDKCEKCGMAIDDNNVCTCGPKICYHCCVCGTDCECGCLAKEDKEKAE